MLLKNSNDFYCSPDLRMEVLHLTEERNSLSHQLAHDAVEFEKTIKSMKKTEEKYQEENRSLEKQITDHEEVRYVLLPKSNGNCIFICQSCCSRPESNKGACCRPPTLSG